MAGESVINQSEIWYEFLQNGNDIWRKIRREKGGKCWRRETAGGSKLYQLTTPAGGYNASIFFCFYLRFILFVISQTVFYVYFSDKN